MEKMIIKPYFCELQQQENVKNEVVSVMILDCLLLDLENSLEDKKGENENERY